MDVTEALDREVIVERAESVRFWLLGLGLSSRATGAIQRELGAVIDNDPGGYIDGQRPLAGVTIEEFMAELHKPNAGLVGKVQGVGDTVLSQLRAKIPANSPDLSALAEYDPYEEIPERSSSTEVLPKRRPRRLKQTEATRSIPQATPQRKQEAREEVMRKVEPAPQVASEQPSDPVFEHLTKLWPELHPQGKRAVIRYVSDLLTEV